MPADESPRGADEVDLVIVSSPLQYINAVEQRASVGGRPADLVLIGDRHGGGEVIETLMRRHAPWRSVHRTARRPRPPRAAPRFARDVLDAAHLKAITKLAAQLAGNAYGSVVIGDYRNVSQRLLAAHVGAGAMTLVDDGSVTPQAAAYRAEPAQAPERGQFDLGVFRTALARRLFGEPDLPDPGSVTFFTIYAALLAGRVRPADVLVPNGYPVWRGGGAQPARGAATWLLGSDHAEAGICAPETYRRTVLAGVAALRAERDGPILYRPHRGESPDKVAALAREAELIPATSARPVEIDYLEASERPARVAFIASSAADTLSVIDHELDIVRLATPDDYLVRRAEHIRAVVEMHHAFNPRLRALAGRGTEP